MLGLLQQIRKMWSADNLHQVIKVVCESANFRVPISKILSKFGIRTRESVFFKNKDIWPLLRTTVKKVLQELFIEINSLEEHFNKPFGLLHTGMTEARAESFSSLTAQGLAEGLND